MYRFLVDPTNIKGRQVILEGDDFRHLRQVLRLGPKDTIHVFDGSGIEYVANILTVDKNCAVAEITSSFKAETEPKIRVTLFQGIPKGEKMDLIIQKGIELGVHKIIPVITERTIVHFEKKDKIKKVDRWSRISKEAAKQCRRAYVPNVSEPISFQDAIIMLKNFDNSLFLYENESKKCLKETLKCYNINKIEEIALFVGPEGGFTPQEVELYAKTGHDKVGLGKRILRAETAAISVLSIIMYEMGELA